MTKTIKMLAIDLAKGSFQVCSAGGLCKTLCEAPKERQGRCGGHCGGRLAPDHAVRVREERRDPGGVR